MPVNHQTITQTSVAVFSGQITADVVQLARDALEGFSGDYYFFQYSASEFVLLMADDLEYDDGTLIAADGFDVIDFVYDEQSNTVSFSESGSTSGSAWGNVGGVQYSGGYNGSVYVPVIDRTYYLWHYHIDNDLTVTNTGHYVTYGSFKGLPHLVEGVENYAWMQTALFVGCIVFYLADRIFKRVGS